MRANTGLPFELMVQSIFQEILDQEGARTSRVEHDVELQGRTTAHQIDILWRFERGGITYMTLVQAKDWDSRIKKEHVLAFRAVLDDIPGQPRGILVTRSGFQSGARALADAYGIGLYLPRRVLPKYTITTLGYMEMKLDLPERVLRATVFEPEVRTRFTFLDLAESTLSPVPTRYTPSNVQLLGDDGTVVGSIQDVIKDFLAKMRRTGSLSGRFAHDFHVPTYLKPSRSSKRVHRLITITAEIEIVPQPQPPIPLRSSGLVDFILEDLRSGQRRVYRRADNRGTSP